jgi:hypothetical protein
MFARIAEKFDESYLASLRKSDCEIIAELLIRDLRLIYALPKAERIAIVNLVRDKIDAIERE